MATVFTIGYEQHRHPSTLIETLQAAGVGRLVDVRDLPISRRRGFSKSALASALSDADIEYQHIRALGNPKPYRDLYKSGQVEEGRNAYRAHLCNGSYEELLRLGGMLEETSICLLCFEESHTDCHRAVIVDELGGALSDLEVVHL